MTDYKLEAESGTVAIEAPPASLIWERTPEDWQFWAFVFAAGVTLIFGIIDELPVSLTGCWYWRIALKFVLFVLLGYFIVISRRFRNWQVRLLGSLKKERA